MKRKAIISLIIISFALGCNQKNNLKEETIPLPTEKILNHVIENAIIADSIEIEHGVAIVKNLRDFFNDSSLLNPCCFNEPPCPPPSDYLSNSDINLYFKRAGVILSDKDYKFFNHQIDSSNKMSFNSDKYTLVSEINLDSINDTLDIYCLVSFYKPLFTSDYNYVFVKYDIYRDYFTGFGAYIILRKEGNEWMKVNSGVIWMS